jgi:hypothetical protein
MTRAAECPMLCDAAQERAANSIRYFRKLPYDRTIAGSVGQDVSG